MGGVQDQNINCSGAWNLVILEHLILKTDRGLSLWGYTKAEYHSL